MGTVDVYNRQYYYPFYLVDSAVIGKAKCESNQGLCRVSFDTTAKLSEGRYGYNVLDTDYTNWAVVYSCSDTWNLGIMKREDVWILTRSPSPSDATIAAAKAVIDAKLPDYQGWFWSINAIQGDTWCNYKDKTNAFAVYKTIDK